MYLKLPQKIAICLTAIFSIFLFSTATAQTTYNYTGSVQSYVVPPGVTSIEIETWGAQGGNSADRLTTNATGGKGSYAKGDLAVTPGQTVYIYVGGAGSTTGAGGYNGGGAGGLSTAGSSCSGGYAAGGGGASDVRYGGTALTNRVIVAAGGGGSGRDYCNGTCQPCGCGGSGGNGDANGSAAGNCGYSYPGTGVNFGSAGTLIAGGTGGLGDGSGAKGSNGILGTGGAGAGGSYDVAGGGGGGGYYGGGGGGGAGSGSGVGGGGGAGGSTYVGGVTSSSTSTNVQSGNGKVVITALVTTPVVTTEPSGSTICSGANTSFSIVASNADTYQWQISTNGGTSYSNMSNTSPYSGVTTSTLSLSTTTTGMNGYQYRCIVTDTIFGTRDTSIGAILTINTAPAITVQPSNSTICDGANTSFSVTATGSTLTYQWQVSTNSGVSFSNITNGGIYSNTTTATLNLTGATGVNNNQYRCVVSGACTPAATSNAAALSLNSGPSISAHPSSSSVCDGGNTSFSVTASGIALTYQWQVSTNSGVTFSNITNGGIYSNATTATLNLTGVTGVNNNQYRCVVGSTCTPAATSNAATLTYGTAPSVTVQPANSTICENLNTFFSIAATGTAVTYQWQVSTNGGTTFTNITNGGIYSGATSATLVLTGVPFSVNSYQYRCIASGSCTPADTSIARTLTVTPAPSITGHPANSVVCDGANVSFSVTATGASLTYQWQISTNGGVSFSNIPGSVTATLNLTGVTTSLDNNQYRCVVSGACAPAATSNAATLNVNTSTIVLSTQPSNVTICDGDNASFSVASSSTGLTYQWQVNTTGSTWTNLTNTGIYSGVTTATLNLTGASLPNQYYQFRCVLSNACVSGIASNSAVLTLRRKPVVTDQSNDKTICEGTNTTFVVVATGTTLTYQWQVSTNGGTTFTNISNSGIYSGATSTTLGITGAPLSANGYQYKCIVSGACTPSASTVAKTLTVNPAPAITSNPTNSIICEGGNTTYSITATGTSIYYAWQVSTNGGTSFTNLVDGGSYSGVATNTLTISVAQSSLNNNLYRCVVAGACAPSATSASASLIINSLPAVTTNPTSKTICTGGNTSFTASGTGTGVAYQWQVSTNGGTTFTNLSNAGIYSGVTTTTLSLTGATITNNGYQYRCVVSGTCTPSVNTTAATLNINTLPAITTNPTNKTICEGSGTTFTAAATGTGVGYQWQVSTNGGTTYTNISNTGIYSGATTNTLTLTGASVSVDGYRYRCVASGTCTPAANSTGAILTIDKKPVITGHPVNSNICEGGNTTFSTTATGTGIGYQWQVYVGGTGFVNVTNSGIYSGATTSTLILTGASLAQNGYQYRCLVNGTCAPGVSSNTATLTIDQKPAVTLHPVSHTICSNTNTSFTVNGTGTGVSYQWQVSTNGGSTYSNVSNSGIYSGATTNTLSLTNATTSVNNYRYRCVLSGSLCTTTATSNAATLSVTALVSVTSHPSNRTICELGNTTFSASGSGPGVSYQWEYSASGSSVWTNVPNSSVFSGTTSSTLSVSNANIAYNGFRFRCKISGTCPPNAVSNLATLTLIPIETPAITITSTTPAVCAGSNITFSVSSLNYGGSNPSFQWKRNGSNVGSNSTSYSSSSLSNGDVITCVMTSNAPCPSSSTATSNSIVANIYPLLYTAISISGPPGDSVCATRPGKFTITNSTNGGPSPAYQWKANGVDILGAIGTSYTSTTLNNGDVITCELTSNARCATPVVKTSNSIKMRVVPLSFSSAAIQVTPSTDVCKGDKLDVYCYFTNGGPFPTFDWYINNKKINNTFGSFSSTQLNDGDIIHVVFTNSFVCPEPVITNKETLTIHKIESPSVKVSASSGNVIAPGWTVTFTANPVDGGPAPTFQWRKNGSPIPGETNNTYTTNTLQFGDKIDVVMKADWRCKDKEYTVSNERIVNIPTSVGATIQDRSELTLYPNPNRGTFVLRGVFDNINGKAKIVVLNSLGQKIYNVESDVNSGEINQQLVLPNSTAPGMYMLSIEIDGQVYHKRFSIID